MTLGAYQVGARLSGAPVLLTALTMTWETFLLAQSPGVPLSTHIAAEANWDALRADFRPALVLSPDQQGVLAAHNLQLESQRIGQRYIIGDQSVTPTEALNQVLMRGPLAVPLISLGCHFAEALVATSGLPRAWNSSGK